MRRRQVLHVLLGNARALLVAVSLRDIARTGKPVHYDADRVLAHPVDMRNRQAVSLQRPQYGRLAVESRVGLGINLLVAADVQRHLDAVTLDRDVPRLAPARLPLEVHHGSADQILDPGDKASLLVGQHQVSGQRHL